MPYLGVRPADITSAAEAEIAGDLTVDTNTLHVDAANNRVGVGTTTVDSALHIEQNASGVTETSGSTVKVHNTNSSGRSKISVHNSAETASGSIYYDTDSGMLALQGDTGAGVTFHTGGNTERVRIDTSGFLTLPAGGVVSPHTSSSTAGISLAPEGSIRATAVGTQVFEINRIGDGQIGRFREGGSEEGNISVSGTTVSYNGGHLSRYSQFTDGNRIDGLVKGTVMTNLDQMAEWTKDGVTEDNEQLNCMAVSSVEGDANVAGVFVNWDDDDEDYTADMNVAMTGDMVIRIAQGTTVTRGDLLMSAGDGTAKPQGDDIVRSKTIAKVTSTTKSHTYDDGSYLVPCVLMAC